MGSVPGIGESGSKEQSPPLIGIRGVASFLGLFPSTAAVATKRFILGDRTRVRPSDLPTVRADHLDVGRWRS